MTSTSKFYQAILPAEPGTATLFVEDDQTGRLAIGERVLAWAIERCPARGTTVRPITATGEFAAEFLLAPDGRVQGASGVFPDLDAANAPAECAWRVRVAETYSRRTKP